MRCRYLKRSVGLALGIQDYPNFHHTGSITGMKKLFYGKDALLVRCGQWIYNVTSSPEIYWRAK